MVKQRNDRRNVTRQLKNIRKLRKFDSSDPNNEINIDKDNSDRPCLVQIPGKQVVKDDDIHVSPEAQENYAHNVNTGNQLKISQGNKSVSGLKNETFKRFNTSHNSALLKQTEGSKSGKNYGFGLDLPDSLRSEKKNAKTTVNKASRDSVEIEETFSGKLDLSNKSEESKTKPAQIALDKYRSKAKEDYLMEMGSYSAFMKRVSLGMSALACLTIAMWWGQHKQVANGEGLRIPEVAMMQSSQRSDYHLVSEKVKRIGNSSVVFVDFELSSPSLNLNQIYPELDRRIIRSESNTSFRFRFFKPSDRNIPYLDLFAGFKPSEKVVEKFDNREEYRGLSVLWNSSGQVSKRSSNNYQN